MASKDSKYWKQVLKAAERQGLRVERPGDRRNKDGSRKKGKHIRVTNPETGVFCVVANTPSDTRGILNAISHMRNMVGFVWQGR